jgi:acyl-CoA reductase-like NAD-dependent aldehyde dehydrogenase
MNIQNPDRAARLAELVSQFLPKGGIGSVIAGEVMPGHGDDIVLIDAATGLHLASYADGGAVAAEAAVQVAQAALTPWQALTASARGRIIWEIGR